MSSCNLYPIKPFTLIIEVIHVRYHLIQLEGEDCFHFGIILDDREEVRKVRKGSDSEIVFVVSVRRL